MSTHRTPYGLRSAWLSVLLVVLLAAAGAESAAASAAAEDLFAYEPDSRTFTDVDRNLDGILLKTTHFFMERPAALHVAPSYSSDALAIDDVGRGLVRVSLHEKNGSIRSDIASLGGEVTTDHAERFGFLQCWIPIDRIRELALAPNVRLVSAVARVYYESGDVESEGDTVHGSKAFRQATGVDGKGVRIGVISDGVDDMGEAQATGELPPCVHSLWNFNNPFTHENEGTAMLEIVHDLAPGANLSFHSAYLSGELINALDGLRADSCRVIVDDVLDPMEPAFEDGPIAQAWAEAAGDGVVVVSSAGNYRNNHYQGEFDPNGPFSYGGDQFENTHDWLADGQSTLEFRAAAEGQIILHWSEKSGHAATDYNIYLYNKGTQDLIGSAQGIQDGHQDPYERLTWSKDKFFDAVLIVDCVGGDPSNEIELYFFGVGLANPIGHDSILGHAAADGVIACAAAHYSQATQQTEYYSSAGPVTLYWPGGEAFHRNKPEITGCDGVSVSGAGNWSTEFSGTSAAAPHIGALCALILDADPHRSPADVLSILTSTAKPIGTESADLAGAGLADASGWGPDILHFPFWTAGGDVEFKQINEVDYGDAGIEVETEVALPELLISPEQQGSIDRIISAQLLLDVTGVFLPFMLEVRTGNNDWVATVPVSPNGCRATARVEVPPRFLVEAQGSIPLKLVWMGGDPGLRVTLHSAALRLAYVAAESEPAYAHGGWRFDDPFGQSMTYEVDDPPTGTMMSWTAPSLGGGIAAVRSARICTTAKNVDWGDCTLSLNGQDLGVIEATGASERVRSSVFVVPESLLPLIQTDGGNLLELRSTSPFSLYSWDLTVDCQLESDASVLSFDPLQSQESLPGSFSRDLTVAAVTNLKSVTTEIRFDPDLLRCIAVREGQFLNEGGTTTTEYDYSIDNAAGMVTVGIVRDDSYPSGVSTVEPAAFAEIEFSTKAIGEGTLVYEGTALRDANDQTIPSTSAQGRVQVGASGQIGLLLTDPRDVEVPIGEEFDLDLLLSNVENCFAIAADVIYPASLLTVVSVMETTLLSENGLVETTMLYDDQPDGRLVFSLTRLDASRPGLRIDDVSAFATIRFRAIRGGDGSIGFERVGAFPPDGLNSYPITPLPATVLIPGGEQSVPVFFDHAEIVREVPQIFDLALCCGPVTNLYGVAAEIQYDPAMIQCLAVDEESFLNDSGDMETTLLHRIDAAAGSVELGVTRVGDVPGRTSPNAANRIARVRFRCLHPGESLISLQDVGLIAPDGETRFSSVVTGCAVQGLAPGTETVVRFFPEAGAVYVGEEYHSQVTIRNVANLFAVVGEVTYDPAIIQILDLEEQALLSDGGSTPTSFLWTDDGLGRVIFGLTRLNPGDVGASAEGEAPAFSIRYRGLNPGVGVLDLANLGLILPDGTSLHEFTSSSGQVEVIPQEQLTVQPGPQEGLDAFVSSANAGINYGAAEYLRVRSASDICRSLLAFDVSSIPATEVVARALLNVYVYQVDQAAGVDIRAIQDDWEEPDVTWNTAPPTGGVLANAAASAPGWLSFDITSLAAGWTSGVTPNHGVLLRLANENQGGIWAYSSDEDTAIDDRPILEVFHYQPADRAGSILGHVTDAVTGQPIPGATVQLTGDHTDETTTGMEGNYLLSGVPEAAGYVVVVSKSGYATATNPYVTVTTGQATTVDITLEREEAIDEYAWDLRSGWNLVSTPLRLDPATPDSVFVHAASCLTWDDPNYGEYEGSLSPGMGFWLQMPADEVVRRTGPSETDVQLDILEGWSLIGGPSEPVRVEDIVQSPPQSLTSCFVLQGHYAPTDLVVPGQAVWLNASRDCRILLSNPAAGVLASRRVRPAMDIGSPSGESREQPDLLVPIRIRYPQLDLEWEVAFGFDPGASIGLDPEFGEVELPPAPPDGVPDGRWLLPDGHQSGTDVRPLAENREFSFAWAIAADTDLLRLSWDAEALPDSIIWWMRDEMGGQVLSIDMKATESVLLMGPTLHLGRLVVEARTPGAMPPNFPMSRFGLRSVYPNPSASRITVTFDLPLPGPVDLFAHSVTGRRIPILRNRHFDAGRHAYSWLPASADLASGQYLLTLRAGSTAQSRKFVYLK